MFCYGSDCDVDLQFRLFFPLLSHKAPIFRLESCKRTLGRFFFAIFALT